MKIIIYILIVVVKMCISESSIYDWHVRTIEHDTDFGDDLKMQTALNNERQQDLLKISGKLNNYPYYNSYYSPVSKSNDKSNNIVDIKERNQNFFQDEVERKHGEEADIQPLFNNARKYEAKKYYNSDYKGDQVNTYKDNNQNTVFNNQWIYPNEDREGLAKNMLLSYHEIINQYDNNLVDRGENSTKNITDINHQPGTNISQGVLNKIKNNDIPNNSRNLTENAQCVSAYNCSRSHIDINSFVGTNLFDVAAKKCFSNEDMALLAIRKDFENLIPKNLPQCLFNDHMVALLLNYFYICHQIVMQTSPIGYRHLAQKAFYDTLGGYLNFYMVPVAKYSYYAGQISLTTAQQVLNLHQESIKSLNTNGNGWKAPMQNILTDLNAVYIEPLHIPELDKDTSEKASYCMQLYMNTDDNQPDNDKMIVQLPKLDGENVNGLLSNIWIPFKRKRTFDLKSEGSIYILEKYYESVTKCYQSENIDQEFYNQLFKKWLLDNINMHLADNEFYPGLGAVLRIYEYLKVRRKYVIGIGNDLSAGGSMGEYNEYRNHQIKNITTKHNERADNQNNLEKAINENLKESNKSNNKLVDDIAEQHNNRKVTKRNKLEAAIHSVAENSKALFRTIDLTPSHVIIVAIPVIAVVVVLIIWCFKCSCKKKKPEAQLLLEKSTSSSSSNLFNSPVRFFHIRKKSASNISAKDPSTYEADNKKNKKSVKIDKKPLLNSDSSMSNSPIRNKKAKESNKSKEKGKSKDSAKSNSKSSWETTYSSK